MSQWPTLLGPEYATAMVARTVPEDFEVEEFGVPEPEGQGEHLWLWIEKRGRSTDRAATELARALGVARSRVRHSGLKDARAVTRQWLSVDDPRGELAPAPLADLGPDLRVLRTVRGQRALRLGDHAGNRFTLRLRGVPAEGAARLAAGLAVLAERGLPAAFGPQRFGARGDGAAIGTALLRGDGAEAVALLAGRPGPQDHGAVREARALFEAGDFEGAAGRFPPGYEAAARLSRAMARERGRVNGALRALSRDELGFFVHAAQALVFNRVLALRLPHLERLLDGDLVEPSGGGRGFPIASAAEHQPRAERFELDPTGPLAGRRGVRPTGAALALEDRAFAELGLEPALFDSGVRYGVQGGRRALRLRVGEGEVSAGSDELGAFVRLRFTLPPGGYASALLSELGQDRLEVRSADPGETAAGC